MARALGMGVAELVYLAANMPDAFDSLAWHALHPGGKPDWQRDGETMRQSRDRMKRERAEARARYG